MNNNIIEACQLFHNNWSTVDQHIQEGYLTEEDAKIIINGTLDILNVENFVSDDLMKKHYNYLLKCQLPGA